MTSPDALEAMRVADETQHALESEVGRLKSLIRAVRAVHKLTRVMGVDVCKTCHCLAPCPTLRALGDK